MQLQILFIVINVSCVVAELSLRFVFVTEHNEVDLPRKLGEAIKFTEESNPGIKVSDAVIQLVRENESESYRQLCSAISKGVSAIIDLSWAPWTLLEELVTETGIPLVRSVLGSQQLVTAFDKYLALRNATDAVFILETEADVDQTLYELLGQSNTRVWVTAGLTRETANSLRAMRPDPSFFVIVGSGSFVMKTYTRAVKEKLVRRDFRWNLLLTDYVTPDLSQLILPTMVMRADAVECCKLTGMRNDCGCPREIQRKQFILTSLLQYLTEVYTRLDPDLQFTSPVNCEDLGESLNLTRDRLYRQLADDTELNNETVFFWDESRYSLLLRSKFVLSTYKPEEGLDVIAKWSANEDFKLLPGAMLEPLKNFFRIGTSAAIPWTMAKLDPDTGEPLVDENGNPLYHGYCIDLIAKLAEVMNFDYEIITPRSGTFGKRLPNGSWDGIIDDLMRGETDIAAAALTMTAEREEVIDFVAPYFEQTGILIVIRRPIRKTSLFKFMTVLRTEVWLSIVGALLLTGFMIWLLEKYSPYSARNNPEAYPYPCRNFTLKESFWFALTSFTPQGGGEAPKALSGRTLVAAYWLFVVLMLATFTANLAAFLTVERMQTPVSSLEQLARQSRINYTVVEGSTVHQYFINMKFAEDTLYRVWKEITLNATSDQAQYRVWDYPIREQYGHILLAINASGPVPDAATGFRQVNDHTEADFTFIHDSAEIKYELTRNCNLTEVGEVFAEQPYALAVQQGSRLQEDLSRALLDLQKERFLEQLASKYWNETARHSCPDADESEGITLESLGGVFIATLFGLGLAMITLAWEVFYYKRKEKNKVQSFDATIEKTKPKLPFKKMADSVNKLRRRGKKTGNTKQVTIGDKFKPVSEKGVSFISVYPRGYDTMGGYNP